MKSSFFLNSILMVTIFFPNPTYQGSCTYGCKQCNPGSKKCYTCEPGFRKHLGSCFSCLKAEEGCGKCQQSEYICQGCKSGYYDGNVTNSNEGVVCFNCVSDCADCVNNSTCLKCKNWFTLTSSKKCRRKVIFWILIIGMLLFSAFLCVCCTISMYLYFHAPDTTQGNQKPKGINKGVIRKDPYAEARGKRRKSILSNELKNMEILDVGEVNNSGDNTVMMSPEKSNSRAEKYKS